MTNSREWIGEERFNAICQKEGLNSQEIDIIKEILAEWDKVPEDGDSFERQTKKMCIAINKVENLSSERRKKAITAIVELTFVFAKARMSNA